MVLSMIVSDPVFASLTINYTVSGLTDPNINVYLSLDGVEAASQFSDDYGQYFFDVQFPLSDWGLTVDVSVLTENADQDAVSIIVGGFVPGGFKITDVRVHDNSRDVWFTYTNGVWDALPEVAPLASCGGVPSPTCGSTTSFWAHNDTNAAVVATVRLIVGGIVVSEKAEVVPAGGGFGLDEWTGGVPLSVVCELYTGADLLDSFAFAIVELGTPPPPECVGDAECVALHGPNHVCQNGVCVYVPPTQCSSNSDCGVNEECVNGVCVGVTPPPPDIPANWLISAVLVVAALGIAVFVLKK